MAQDVLNHTDVDPSIDAPCSEGVPQGVEDVGLIEAQVIPNLLEGPEQLVLVVPFVSEQADVGTNRLHAVDQHLADPLMDWNGPVVASLGDEALPTTDVDQTSREVDVSRFDREQFPHTGACVCGKENDLSQVLTVEDLPGSRGHGLDLILGEVGNAVFHLPASAKARGSLDDLIEGQVIQDRGDCRDYPVDGGISFALLLQFNTDLLYASLIDAGNRVGSSSQSGEMPTVDRSCLSSVSMSP